MSAVVAWVQQHSGMHAWYICAVSVTNTCSRAVGECVCNLRHDVNDGSR